jgi:hypothetical protein
LSDFQATPDPDLQPALEPTQPTQPAIAAPPLVRRKSNRTGNILLGVAGLVAIGGIAFAAGRITAPAATASGVFPGGGNFPSGSFDPGAFPGGPQNGGLGARLGGTTVQGEVTAISDTSITVRLENGSTVDIPLDDSTTYKTATDAAATDVAVGSNVLVQPSDVQFNPGGQGNPNAAGSPQPLTLGPARQVIVVGE